MSSSGSSSSSPEPEIAPAANQRKTNGKGKSKNKDLGKNEDTDPHWAYKPPAGSVVLGHGVDSGDFDWDAVENQDDVELWLIRLPDGVKPKFLENVKLEPTASAKSSRLGTLDRKHVSYDIWSLGDADGDDQDVGGEELSGISCLLPRKSKNGKLFAAPKTFARRLVVSAQPVKPTPVSSSGDAPGTGLKFTNPPRQSYPKDVLKHRFLPYGAHVVTEGDAVLDTMDVDVEPGAERSGKAVPIPIPKASEKDSDKKKGKKRKGEANSAQVVTARSVVDTMDVDVEPEVERNGEEVPLVVPKASEKDLDQKKGKKRKVEAVTPTPKKPKKVKTAV